MAQTMTPSAESKAMTKGQISKAAANYRALLEKHAGEFDSVAVQTALGQPELANEQLAVFRHRVEAISEMVVRRVLVKRNRTPKESVDATGRVQYVNGNVRDNMPRCGHPDQDEEWVDVCFFPLKTFKSAAEVQTLIEQHGLVPDPQAVAAVNEQDPSFADERSNGTQWVDSDGSHCYLIFDRWDDERYVGCNRGGNDWNGGWWVGGSRASSLSPLGSDSLG